MVLTILPPRPLVGRRLGPLRDLGDEEPLLADQLLRFLLGGGVDDVLDLTVDGVLDLPPVARAHDVPPSSGIAPGYLTPASHARRSVNITPKEADRCGPRGEFGSETRAAHAPEQPALPETNDSGPIGARRTL